MRNSSICHIIMDNETGIFVLTICPNICSFILFCVRRGSINTNSGFLNYDARRAKFIEVRIFGRKECLFFPMRSLRFLSRPYFESYVVHPPLSLLRALVSEHTISLFKRVVISNLYDAGSRSPRS